MNTEYQDIIIVGAGLSGIGAACHISKNCPNKSLAILESRESMGGTWDFFRYPGIRSDSDMFTLGYNFKPWRGDDAIADGPSILNYIKEAANEHSLEEKIRYQHKVTSMSWCSKSAKWTLQLMVDGEACTMSCSFLLSCTGYYNYDKGFTPNFKGKDDFKGQFIHPQQWPEDLDYSDKKIVVIGSGATSVTLVPELAKKSKHVTMLQRSPTYVATVPKQEKTAIKLRKILPEKWVYRIIRARKVTFTLMLYKFCRAFPGLSRKLFTTMAKKQLGKDFDLKHFSPSYAPWDERLCAVPDGDLFKTLRNGGAQIVTDTIDTITANGIKLNSGDVLEADIIVSATGLDLKMMGGIDIEVDGAPFIISDSMVYRGVLVENLPNVGLIFGYTNASWTLKSDLTSEFVCRIINHLDKTHTQQCRAVNSDKRIGTIPFIDMNSGYIHRAANKMPQQGNKIPWRLYQNYLKDMFMLRLGSVKDGVLKFEKAQTQLTPANSEGSSKQAAL